jgi:cation diffusion facilitator CzcD-associated flavoprotein CzcO
MRPRSRPDYRRRTAVGTDYGELVGKRVAVIGSGAFGVQAITEIAKTMGRLTVFQRTLNRCAPLRNSRIDAETMGKIRATYAEVFARCRETYGCFIHGADPRNALEVSDEEREAFYEKLGLRLLAMIRSTETVN